MTCPSACPQSTRAKKRTLVLWKAAINSPNHVAYVTAEFSRRCTNIPPTCCHLAQHDEQRDNTNTNTNNDNNDNDKIITTNNKQETIQQSLSVLMDGPFMVLRLLLVLLLKRSHHCTSVCHSPTNDPAHQQFCCSGREYPALYATVVFQQQQSS